MSYDDRVSRVTHAYYEDGAWTVLGTDENGEPTTERRATVHVKVCWECKAQFDGDDCPDCRTEYTEPRLDPINPTRRP